MLKEIIQTNSRSIWLITPNAASDLIERWGSVLSNPAEYVKAAAQKPEPKETDDDFIKTSAAAQFAVQSGSSLIGSYQLRYGQIPENSIAVIEIDGVLMKYDSCGYYGTQSYASFIDKAANNPNIKGIIIPMDTPGGNVAGVRLLADAINNAKKKKPVVAWICDGTCASGGYWIASQCDEIISSHSTNIIGSIGVMIGLRDTRKRDEAIGINDIVIYADGSEEKHSEIRNALDGDVSAVKAKMLNPIREEFVKAVKAGRSGKLQTKPTTPLKGAIFGDITSKNIGLVDSIGDLQAAVVAVERRAKTFSNNPPKPQPNSSSDMKTKLIVGKHDAFITAMGLKAENDQKEFEVDVVDLLASSSKATADALIKVTESVTGLSGKIDEINTAAKTTTDSITALQEEVNALGESNGVIRKPKAEKGTETSDAPKGRLYARS